MLKEIVVHSLPRGLRLRLRRYYLVRQTLKRRGSPEAEFGALPGLIEEGDVVLDVGANIGDYTVELSHLVGPRGRVLAIEPIPETHAILSEVVSRGNLANVECHALALGSESGKREMIVPRAAGVSGYYLAHFTTDKETEGDRTPVSVATLDDLAAKEKVSRIDFIKCDVEGAEVEVLQGGLELIRAHRPIWLVEVGRVKSGPFFGLMTDLGYKAYVLEKTGLTPTAGYRDKEFSNYFFIHPESKKGRTL